MTVAMLEYPRGEIEFFVENIFLASLGCPNALGLPAEPRNIALVKSWEKEALEDTLFYQVTSWKRKYPLELKLLAGKVFLINQRENHWTLESLSSFLERPIPRAPSYASLEETLAHVPARPKTVVMFFEPVRPEWEEAVRGTFEYFQVPYPRLDWR